ncbi:hypothetical protein SAMN05421780_106221 [Flexibacter flexilis DSM 6793]|uniref:Uncharacterized protein n=1 Tax=Flexibacter flexilis DSM 6793 TaxID=927664 RepID=A0A1I1K2Q6_9BACT|nr:hypothetical protein [Flexibacter flexilis]SFC55016.1 hypothetical protein SAMN05421780_106221 [Flexibacter flexilis DSM 6793]
MKKNILSIAILSTALLLYSCGGETKKETEEDPLAETETATDANSEVISPAVFNDVLNSIPSPIETSSLIKESGGKYDKTFLNPTKNTGNYTTNYYKALNLGIYGTDLGYTNMYSQSQDAIFYMDAVQEMAKGLNISQFFDITTIKRLATNSNNLDSLLLITTSNLQKINVHLQEKSQANLSLLIVAGGWMEGLHLICKVAEQKPNDKLKEKIGEQKIILGRLVVLMRNSAKDEQTKAFLADIEKLSAAYKDVTINERIEGEPHMEIVDGIPTLVDNKTTTVFISDEQIKTITSLTAEIRDRIINKK